MALEINPDTDPAIEHPFNRHAEGISTNTIAAELNQMGFHGQKGHLPGIRFELGTAILTRLLAA